MALTSVMTAYPTQQNADLSSGAIGLQAFPTLQAVNIPQPKQMSLLNSSDASASLLVPSVTPPHTPYFQSASLPNAYFATPNSTADPFRFIHPTLHALINPYSPFHASTYSTPLVNGHSSRPCLLPTPSPTVQTAGAESMTMSETSTLGRHVISAEAQCESSSVSDDPITSRHVMNNSENPLSHQNPIILIVRLLMSGKEVGSIIGKRGENVKKYREESGARINISDGSSPERIVTITGTTDQIFVAFSLMSQKFEDDFTQGLLRMGDDGVTCPPVTLRLLVPATQCGSIIGKGGSRIKDVRELTGASIQVASEALPTSTERTVTISGSAKAIAKCIRQLCDIFIESPAKGPVIPYRPKPAFVNHPVMCPAGPYPGRVLHSPLPYPGLQGENNAENPYGNYTTTHGLKHSSPVQISTEPSTPIPSSSVGQSVIGTIGMPQPKVVTLDGNNSVAFNNPADSTNPANAINPGRPNLVSDFIGDPAQISGALSYPDFTNNPISLLNAIQSNHLAASTLPNPILNPIAPGFAFSELTINPRLLGFYSPQSISIPQTTGPDTGDDLSDPRQATNAAFLSDLCTNNPMLSLVPPNGYIPSTGMLSPVPASPVPFLPNKSSILGLPAFPLQTTLINQANGLPACPEDTNVIKEIVLSNDLIGCIIGRGGTTVNEIRNISKAQVKISNCEDGAKDRKITLSGSPQAVNLAHFLIVNSVAAHQQMWSLNVQLASAATYLMTRSYLANEVADNYRNLLSTLNAVGQMEETKSQESNSDVVSNSQPNHNNSPNACEPCVKFPLPVPDTELIATLTNTQVLKTKWLSDKCNDIKHQIRSKVAPY